MHFDFSWRRVLPVQLWVVAGFYLALTSVVLLYAFEPEQARRLLSFWMFRPYKYPFLDWEWMSRSIECWRRGVDVFVFNPCPEPVPINLFTQSPLWLHIWGLPVGDEYVPLVGLSLAVLFGLALATLPRVYHVRDGIVLLLVALSSSTAFALERANVDIVLFILVVVGVRLYRGRLTLRLLGYGLLFLAGLLKYFPLAALILCLRDRRWVSISVLVVAAVVLTGLVLALRSELQAALHNVPVVWFFGDGFGASDFAAGVSTLLGQWARGEGAADSALVGPGILVVKNLTYPLIIAAAFAGWLIAERGGVRRLVGELDPAYLAPLVACAALIVGCFVTARSIGYRGIFLIPTVPGLLLLSRQSRSYATRLWLFTTCLLIVVVEWMMGVQGVLVGMGLRSPLATLSGDAIGVALWLFKESCWWSIVVTLFSVMFGFLCDLPATNGARELIGRWTNRELERQA